jgi:hypothetical protein
MLLLLSVIDNKFIVLEQKHYSSTLPGGSSTASHAYLDANAQRIRHQH